MRQLGEEEEARLTAFYAAKGKNVEKDVLREFEERGKVIEKKMN